MKIRAHEKIVFTVELPKDHLPGLHWVHPHHQGSSTLQGFTANGLIVVEGTS